MRAVVWDALAERSILQDDRSTWTVETPHHLQHLKKAAPFRAVASARTMGAIDDVLGTGAWQPPRDWGAFFLLFPTARRWTAPSSGWHLDASYHDPLDPLGGLKVQTIFGDVAPRAGGMTIVAGSHRVAARHAAARPETRAEPMEKARRALLESDPWLVALTTDGDPAERVARFVDREDEAWGLPVRVVELTGDAGDVVLIHPLVLHARPTNAGTEPRFLLNKDLRRQA
jgi:hypothetical protein